MKTVTIRNQVTLEEKFVEASELKFPILPGQRVINVKPDTFAATPAASPSAVWEEIKGKAHLYETAKLNSVGRFVKILRVVAPGTFAISAPIDGKEMHVGCNELSQYGL